MVTIEKTGVNTLNCDSLLLLKEGQSIAKIIHDTVTSKPIVKVVYTKGKNSDIKVETVVLKDTVLVPFKTVVAAPPVVCPEPTNKWRWFAYGCLATIAIFVTLKAVFKWLGV